jgi:arginine utilization protein RocB
MADRARDWAIWLTRFGTVTGTRGEREFPAVLAEKLGGSHLWHGCEIWQIPAPNDALGRSCLAVLARGFSSIPIRAGVSGTGMRLSG